MKKLWLFSIMFLFLFLASCSQEKESISNNASWETTTSLSWETIKSLTWTQQLTWSTINKDLSWIPSLSWSVGENVPLKNESKKQGCSLTLLSPYPKEEYLQKDFFKYANKTRVFTLKSFSECKNKELNLKNGGTLPLSTGGVINITDMATASFGSHVGMKTIKTLKISSLSEISLWEKCRESLDTWEDECFGKWIIWNFWSLIFRVDSWLTESNMYEVFDEVKMILESIEEKKSIEASFDPKKVNLSETTVIGNTIFLKDSQGWEKKVPVSFTIFKDGTFEDVSSEMDISFSKIEWKNLHIDVFYWNAMKWFTYYNIVVDIDSWKTIQFETTYEDPEY